MTATRIFLALGVAFLGVLCATLVGTVVASGQDATETESISSTDDATIREVYPDESFGESPSLVADASRPALMAQYTLIRWDLSGIAPGTDVDAASVTLSVTNPSIETFEAYALERPWAESEASWRAYAAGEPWEAAGARGSLDRQAQPAGSVTPSATGEQSFALSTEVVQRWVDDPASNHGIVLQDDPGNWDGIKFHSSEADGGAEVAPRLEVSLAGGAPPPQDDAAVLVGAGDIASCNSSGDEATARLLDEIPGTVYTTGDNAYDGGTAAQFESCYEPSWGRHKGRTKPSVGNHEYETPGAPGYFGYFGEAAGEPGKGYYSYDRGSWHVVVLNSECWDVGGCGPEDPQIRWLEQDLAANPSACTLAYWHTPLYSSSRYGYAPRMKPAWEALFGAGAEVVLNGHAHLYERFAPMEPDGEANPEGGIREFVVGTGGASHYPVADVQPNSEVRNADTYGVLKLTLRPSGYEWEFVPVAGETFTDSGTQGCH
jgi:hypothetical protein